MVGAVSNTVSPSQVDKLLGDFGVVVKKARDKIDIEGNNFFKNLGAVWAGEDAVESSKRLADSLNEYLIDNLASGFNYIAAGVIDLANYYAKRANKLPMNPRSISFTHNISSSPVKSQWDDGSYGFKEPKSLASLIVAFDLLKSSINKTAIELSENIARINAFGNPEIKKVLNNVSNAYTDSLLSSAKLLSDAALKIIEDTSRKYNISADQIASYFAQGNKPEGLQSYLDVMK